MRVAVVGHFTYFENHFPEGWRRDPRLMCMDVSERDYSWLMVLRNYRPNITLFYRPELYPERYLRHIDGVRVAFLSEPLPSIVDGRLSLTGETDLRMTVLSWIAWDAYHWRIYYDPGKAPTAAFLNYPIDDYRPLPIDTNCFRPPMQVARRRFDVCFVGKPTAHRIAKLDFLRSSRLRFLWVAHGISGQQLASLFRRTRLVLNVHADGAPAFEPRIFLGAACGCRVVTEPLSSPPQIFRRWIACDEREWSEETLLEHLSAWTTQEWSTTDEEERISLSTWRLIDDIYSRFNGSTVAPSEA